MPFKKGQSGNPGGRVQDKPWAEALRRAAYSDDAQGKRRLLAIAEKCVAAAENGDMAAMKEIGDRLDGKPAQESTVTVQRTRAVEMSDSELDDIIARSSGGEEGPPNDPSQLN